MRRGSVSNIGILSAAKTGHQIARLDGGAAGVWEPLWRRRTELRPIEQALLTTWPLRRLHYIHHAGGAYLSMPHNYSRLQHTLGVFALAAHFHPEDDLLRAAALLHDIGHLPFSHTLERLDGLDHHRWTIDQILSAPIADILDRHKLDPPAVLACIQGQPANVLRNQTGLLHADHLDSWVRSAQTSGLLARPASTLLARLQSNGEYIQTDLETAELLLELIVAEARFHMSAVNLGINTILADLVKQALEAGALAGDDLAAMTDGALERILFTTPVTAKMARRLWQAPQTITVRQLTDEAPPAGAYVVPVERLYLSVPLVNDQPVTAISARAAALLAEAEKLLGTYAVFWNGDEA